MAKNAPRRRLLLCLAVLLAGGALVVVLLTRPAAEQAPWPGRCDTVAERAYVMDRLRGLVDAWYDAQPPSGSKDEPRPLLLVDLRRPAVWIQRGQTVYEQEWVNLPRQVAWMLYLQEPPDGSILPTPSAFGLPRADERVFGNKTVLLVATWQEGGHSYVEFGMRTGSGGSSGAFQTPAFEFVPDGTKGKPTGITFVPQGDLPPLPLTSGGRPLLSHPTDGGGDPGGWVRAARRLYPEIERRMRYKGLDLSDLSLKPGPSWQGAHGSADGNPLSSRALRGGPPVGLSLMVKCLGDGVWYCRGESAAWRPEDIELGFLVTEDGSAPPGGRDWLAEGRALVLGGPEPGRWVAEMADGTTVEVVGILDRSGAATRCWEPDGTVIRPAPLFMPPRQLSLPPEFRQVVVALRVHLAITGWSQGWFAASDDSLGMGTCGLVDEYGLPPPDVDGHTSFFRVDLETTSLRIGRALRPEAGAVVFENVSLVPGRHTDCTITVELPAAP
jgi:hypothetical protein